MKKGANKLYIRRKGQIVLTFHVNETRRLSIEWQACIWKRFCSSKSAESQNVTITQRHACTTFYSFGKVLENIAWNVKNTTTKIVICNKADCIPKLWTYPFHRNLKFVTIGKISHPSFKSHLTIREYQSILVAH